MMSMTALLGEAVEPSFLLSAEISREADKVKGQPRVSQR